MTVNVFLNLLELGMQKMSLRFLANRKSRPSIPQQTTLGHHVGTMGLWV